MDDRQPWIEPTNAERPSRALPILAIILGVGFFFMMITLIITDSIKEQREIRRRDEAARLCLDTPARGGTENQNTVEDALRFQTRIEVIMRECQIALGRQKP